MQHYLHSTRSPAIPGSISWPTESIFRRHHCARYVANFALAFVGIVVCITLPLNSPPATAGLLLLVAFLVGLLVWGIAVLCRLHPYLLAPKHYVQWLRLLAPYEPATFWGQSLHRLGRFVGGACLLVVGAVIGAVVGKQNTINQISDAAFQWLGASLSIGLLYIWWTGFVIQLATIHRRALRAQQLPFLSQTPLAVWPLFGSIWMCGVVLTVLAVAFWPVFQNALRAYLGLQ